VHLVYVDESDLHMVPRIRAMWMKGCARGTVGHDVLG
jgi:hypothetical protein